MSNPKTHIPNKIYISPMSKTFGGNGFFCTINPGAGLVAYSLVDPNDQSLDDKAASLGIVSEGQKLTPAALEAWASRERSKIDQIRSELVGKMLSLDPMRDEYQRGGYDAIRQDIEIIDRINPKEAK